MKIQAVNIGEVCLTGISFLLVATGELSCSSPPVKGINSPARVTPFGVNTQFPLMAKPNAIALRLVGEPAS